MITRETVIAFESFCICNALSTSGGCCITGTADDRDEESKAEVILEKLFAALPMLKCITIYKSCLGGNCES